MGKISKDVPGDVIKMINDIPILDWDLDDWSEFKYRKIGSKNCDVRYSKTINDVDISIGKKNKWLKGNEFYLCLDDDIREVMYGGDIVKDMYNDIDFEYRRAVDTNAEDIVIKKLKGD